MKKIILILSVLLLALTSCSKRRIKNIVGVYELREYTQTKNNITTDLIEKYGYESYYVIDANGKGYYIVKNNEEDYICREISIEYNYKEDSKDIKSLNLSLKYNEDYLLGKSNSNYLEMKYYPSDEKLKKSGIIGFLPTVKMNMEYYKISNKADLSIVFDRIGKSLDVLSYDLSYYNNTFVYEAYEENHPTIYDYFIVDLDVINMKADIYYRVKDEYNTVLLGLDVSYSNIAGYDEFEIDDWIFTGSGDFKSALLDENDYSNEVEFYKGSFIDKTISEYIDEAFGN